MNDAASPEISEQDFEWNLSDRFKSNDGDGPLTARILSVSNGEVHMERWARNRRAAVRFSLPIAVFLSPRCGWEKVLT